MNIKLLECKRKAIELVQSNVPPRNSTGRMKGYMAVMKELWDESEFANDLNLSSQNLRDQAARIEKSFGNVRATIREEVNADNGESLFDAVYLERNEGQDLEQQEDALRRLRGMYWFSKNYVEWRWKVEKCINNKCVQERGRC